MQIMHGIEQHRAPNSPDQRYEPAAFPVVLGASPHRALHREGNEQAKCLQEPQKRVVGVHHGAACRLDSRASARFALSPDEGMAGWMPRSVGGGG